MRYIMVKVRPVPKARPRSTKSGHHYTPRTTEVAEARIREAWIAEYGSHEPFVGAVRVDIDCWLARPKAHYGSGRNSARLKPGAPSWVAHKPDWDNLAKTVCDALNGVAWRDDGQIASAIVTKRYAVEPGQEGWEISVYSEGEI